MTAQALGAEEYKRWVLTPVRPAGETHAQPAQPGDQTWEGSGEHTVQHAAAPVGHVDVGEVEEAAVFAEA
jgi:hypothetical protein